MNIPLIVAVVILSVLALVFAIGSGIFFCRWRKVFVAFQLSVKMLEAIQEDYEIPDWQIDKHYLPLANQKIREEIMKANRKKPR